ncbi:hypothetical protein OG778_30275 [Streptomyces sp. NBC_00184]|uniref:hypothetical protein n=1 Tax=Streptomyces sp. NBC_00184 TaxID=2975673 RepID=UPI002E2B771E|nr:hypothetical protein [Streptomyces sp. NBC_00184]
MTTVSWRTPQKNTDRAALDAFKCAERVPPSRKAPSWELEVEKYFHGQVWADTNRSRSLDQRFRVAEDVEGIAAAYTHARAAGLHPELSVPADTICRYMVMLGIAIRYRHQSGKFADEVLLNALYDIQDREAGQPEIVVFAKVHRHNQPSQKMLGRAGFEEDIPGTSASPLAWWSLILQT